MIPWWLLICSCLSACSCARTVRTIYCCLPRTDLPGTDKPRRPKPPRVPGTYEYNAKYQVYPTSSRYQDHGTRYVRTYVHYFQGVSQKRFCSIHACITTSCGHMRKTNETREGVCFKFCGTWKHREKNAQAPLSLLYPVGCGPVGPRNSSDRWQFAIRPPPPSPVNIDVESDRARL